MGDNVVFNGFIILNLSTFQKGFLWHEHRKHSKMLKTAKNKHEGVSAADNGNSFNSSK